jgi:hypoxanthine-guanine phosphoribosyltransferase
VVLSVMGGAAIFTGQLLPRLAFPLEFGAIEVTRYNNDIQGREITWRLAAARQRARPHGARGRRHPRRGHHARRDRRR